MERGRRKKHGWKDEKEEVKENGLKSDGRKRGRKGKTNSRRKKTERETGQEVKEENREVEGVGRGRDRMRRKKG